MEQGEKKSSYKGPDSSKRIFSANKRLSSTKKTAISSRKKKAKIKTDQSASARASTLSRKSKDRAQVKMSNLGFESDSDGYSETSSEKESLSKNLFPPTDDIVADDVGDGKIKCLFAPVLLQWQSNSCFIDSLVQCFLSCPPLWKSIVESNNTWEIGHEKCVFVQVALLMQDVKELWSKIDDSDGHEDINIDAPLLNIRDCGYTSSIKSDRIKRIMEYYENGVDFYERGDQGHPMQFLGFLLHDATLNCSRPNHPFISLLSMGINLQKIWRCNSCKKSIPPPGDACKEKSHGMWLSKAMCHVCLPSSAKHGSKITDMLDNFILWSESDYSTGNNHLQCPECKGDVSRAEYKECFETLGLNEKKVIVFEVFQSDDGNNDNSTRVESTSHLSSIDLSFDFSPYVNDNTGSQYTAELTGYIYEPFNKKDHYNCVVKGREGSIFFDVDDQLPNDMVNVGQVPDAHWPMPPAYMFYIIRNIGVKTSDPNDVVDLMETSSTDDDDDNTTTNRWKYVTPIGNIDYCFMKKFDVGWFQGQVIYNPNKVPGE